jgi:hypothetical protein
MRLEWNGRLVSDQPDEALIEQTLSQMAHSDTLTLYRPPTDFLQASGSATGGFTLNAYDDTQGINRTSALPLNSAGVVAVFVRYLRGAPDWHSNLDWQSGTERGARSRWRPGAGVIAFAIFTTALLAGLALSQLSDARGRPSAGDWLRGFVGIVVISGYIAWLEFFFRRLRPRLASWLGARLGVSIAESTQLYDAGTWTASGSVGKRLLVMMLDIGIILPGVIGPLALPALIALLVFARW